MPRRTWRGGPTSSHEAFFVGEVDAPAYTRHVKRARPTGRESRPSQCQSTLKHPAMITHICAIHARVVAIFEGVIIYSQAPLTNSTVKIIWRPFENRELSQKITVMVGSLGRSPIRKWRRGGAKTPWSASLCGATGDRSCAQCRRKSAPLAPPSGGFDVFRIRACTGRRPAQTLLVADDRGGSDRAGVSRTCS